MQFFADGLPGADATGGGRSGVVLLPFSLGWSVAGPVDADDGGQQLLLGKMLLERGLITPDQLREALVERARTQSTPLGGILVREGFLTDEQLNDLMAEQRQDVFAPPPYVAPPAPTPSRINPMKQSSAR